MNKLSIIGLSIVLTGCFQTVPRAPECPPPPPAKKQQLELIVQPELLEPPPKLEKL